MLPVSIFAYQKMLSAIGASNVEYMITHLLARYATKWQLIHISDIAIDPSNHSQTPGQ